MPDQTKSHGLRLALNSLESALKVCVSLGKDVHTSCASWYIGLAREHIERHIVIETAQQPRPYVGDERREEE